MAAVGKLQPTCVCLTCFGRCLLPGLAVAEPDIETFEFEKLKTISTTMLITEDKANVKVAQSLLNVGFGTDWATRYGRRLH